MAKFVNHLRRLVTNCLQIAGLNNEDKGEGEDEGVLKHEFELDTALWESLGMKLLEKDASDVRLGIHSALWAGVWGQRSEWDGDEVL